MGDVIDSTLMHINKGDPLSVRESKGNPPAGLNFNIVYYSSRVPSFLGLNVKGHMCRQICRIY